MSPLPLNVMEVDIKQETSCEDTSTERGVAGSGITSSANNAATGTSTSHEETLFPRLVLVKPEDVTEEAQAPNDENKADLATTLVEVKKEPNTSPLIPRKGIKWRPRVVTEYHYERGIACSICHAETGTVAGLVAHLDREHKVRVEYFPTVADFKDGDEGLAREADEMEKVSQLLKRSEGRPREYEPLPPHNNKTVNLHIDEPTSEEESSEDSSSDEEENTEEEEKEREYVKMRAREFRRLQKIESLWEQKKVTELTKARMMYYSQCLHCFIEMPRGEKHRTERMFHTSGHRFPKLYKICPHCRCPHQTQAQLDVHLEELQVPVVPEGTPTSEAQDLLYSQHNCPEPNCGQVFSNRRCLLWHRTSVHNPHAHRCPHCERPFILYHQMRRHIEVAHNWEKRVFQCPVPYCGKYFLNRKGISLHRSHGHKNYDPEVEIPPVGATTSNYFSSPITLWRKRAELRELRDTLKTKSLKFKENRTLVPPTSGVPVPTQTQSQYIPPATGSSRFSRPRASQLSKMDRFIPEPSRRKTISSNEGYDDPSASDASENSHPRVSSNQKVLNLNGVDRVVEYVAGVASLAPYAGVSASDTRRNAGRVGDFRFFCVLCSRCFLESSKRDLHLAQVHGMDMTDERPFICPLIDCGFVCPRGSYLLRHMRQGHAIEDEEMLLQKSLAEDKAFTQQAGGVDYSNLKFETETCSLSENSDEEEEDDEFDDESDIESEESDAEYDGNGNSRTPLPFKKGRPPSALSGLLLNFQLKGGFFCPECPPSSSFLTKNVRCLQRHIMKNHPKSVILSDPKSVRVEVVQERNTTSQSGAKPGVFQVIRDDENTDEEYLKIFSDPALQSKHRMFLTRFNLNKKDGVRVSKASRCPECRIGMSNTHVLQGHLYAKHPNSKWLKKSLVLGEMVGNTKKIGVDREDLGAGLKTLYPLLSKYETADGRCSCPECGVALSTKYKISRHLTDKHLDSALVQSLLPQPVIDKMRKVNEPETPWTISSVCTLREEQLLKDKKAKEDMLRKDLLLKQKKLKESLIPCKIGGAFVKPEKVEPIEQEGQGGDENPCNEVEVLFCLNPTENVEMNTNEEQFALLHNNVNDQATKSERPTFIQKKSVTSKLRPLKGTRQALEKYYRDGRWLCPEAGCSKHFSQADNCMRHIRLLHPASKILDDLKRRNSIDGGSSESNIPVTGSSLEGLAMRMEEVGNAGITHFPKTTKTYSRKRSSANGNTCTFPVSSLSNTSEQECSQIEIPEYIEKRPTTDDTTISQQTGGIAEAPSVSILETLERSIKVEAVENFNLAGKSKPFQSAAGCSAVLPAMGFQQWTSIPKKIIPLSQCSSASDYYMQFQSEDGMFHCPLSACGKTYNAIWSVGRHFRINHRNHPAFSEHCTGVDQVSDEKDDEPPPAKKKQICPQYPPSPSIAGNGSSSNSSFSMPSHNIFPCSKCGHVFTWRNHLRRHLDSNACNKRRTTPLEEPPVFAECREVNGKNYNCPFCSQKEAGMYNFGRHVFNEHSNTPLAKRISEAEIPSLLGMENSERQCNICQKVFSKPLYLYKHLTRCHSHKKELSVKSVIEDPIYALGSNTCGNQGAMMEEELLSQEANIPQEDKDNEISQGDNEELISDDENGLELPPPDIDIVMAREGSLSKGNSKLFTCERCGIQFQHQTRYLRHIENTNCTEKKSGRGNFPCPTCGQVFGFEWNRVRHIQRKACVLTRKGTTTKPGVQKKVFPSKKVLTHKKVHKPIAKTSTSTTYKKLSRSEKAKGSFPCPKCKRVFGYEWNRKSHIRNNACFKLPGSGKRYSIPQKQKETNPAMDAEREVPPPGFEDEREVPPPGFEDEREVPPPGFEDEMEVPPPGFEEEREIPPPGFTPKKVWKGKRMVTDYTFINCYRRSDGFKCPYCPMVLQENYRLCQHLLIVHPGTELTAQVSAARVPGLIGVERVKYKCDICGSILACALYLTRHYKKVHDKKISVDEVIDNLNLIAPEELEDYVDENGELPPPQENETNDGERALPPPDLETQPSDDDDEERELPPPEFESAGNDLNLPHCQSQNAEAESFSTQTTDGTEEENDDKDFPRSSRKRSFRKNYCEENFLDEDEEEGKKRRKLSRQRYETIPSKSKVKCPICGKVEGEGRFTSLKKHLGWHKRRERNKLLPRCEKTCPICKKVLGLDNSLKSHIGWHKRRGDVEKDWEEETKGGEEEEGGNLNQDIEKDSSQDFERDSDVEILGDSFQDLDGTSNEDIEDLYQDLEESLNTFVEEANSSNTDGGNVQESVEVAIETSSTSKD